MLQEIWTWIFNPLKNNNHSDNAMELYKNAKYLDLNLPQECRALLMAQHFKV